MSAIVELDIRTAQRLRQDGASIPPEICFVVQAIDASGNDEFLEFGSESELAAFLWTLHPTPFSNSPLLISMRKSRDEDATAIIERRELLITAGASDDRLRLH